MHTLSEVDRLKGVYHEYTERGWSQTKWAASNRGNQAIRKERSEKLEELLDNAGLVPLHDRRILDIGCGTGDVLAGFTKWGANPRNLFGVDLLAERIQDANKNFPEISFQEANAEALPFENGSFDLVCVFTVFSSILDDAMARNVAGEIDRVLRLGGVVIWYDFRLNNPLNRHVRGISRKSILRLFPGYGMTLAAITLLPPLARRCGPLIHRLYGPLAALPCLRSHYLGLLRKH